jgi:hypothetical protein
MTELQTDEPIVPKPTLALVVRLMCRLTGLQRERSVASSRLREVQWGTAKESVANFACAAIADGHGQDEN